jgi:hypothetical protein
MASSCDLALRVHEGIEENEANLLGFGRKLLWAT